jgi:hypothetical protein
MSRTSWSFPELRQLQVHFWTTDGGWSIKLAKFGLENTQPAVNPRNTQKQ